MNNKSVLLFDGGGTQTLPLAKSLYKKGYILHALYSDKYTYGYGTRYIHHKMILPEGISDSDYYYYLANYLKNNVIDVVIPLGDSAAELLSKYKFQLSKYSKFIIPDYDVFQKAYNKNSLMSICRSHSLPHPKTLDLSQKNDEEEYEDIFPAIIKPNITCGARGMKIVNDRQELEKYYPTILKQYGNCHLQKYVKPGGGQIEVQLFLDNEGVLRYSSVIYKFRFYPVRAGSSCCNITITNDTVVDICYQALKTVGWKGFADFDMIEDLEDNTIKIMELNPRVPACVKAAIESGIDYGNIIVDASLGNKLKDYNYTPGKSLRHIGFEILWFLKSSDRWKTKPNWFNFFHKGLSFQDFSLADPLPFFYGTYGNIKKQLDPEFRKSKTL